MGAGGGPVSRFVNSSHPLRIPRESLAFHWETKAGDSQPQTTEDKLCRILWALLSHRQNGNGHAVFATEHGVRGYQINKVGDVVWEAFDSISKKLYKEKAIGVLILNPSTVKHSP